MTTDYASRIEGSEARIGEYLTGELGFGLAAEVTMTAARANPGRYCYTPDGCAWAVNRGDRWEAGRSGRTEQQLAAERPGPVPARLGPAGPYAAEVPVTDLAPGDVVISVGRLLHLTGKTGHVLGYDHWDYRRYDGTVSMTGTTHLRADGRALVLRGADR